MSAKILFSTLLLLLISFTLAHPSQFERCGAQILSAEEARNVEDVTAHCSCSVLGRCSSETAREDSESSEADLSNLTIQVAFHVVYDPETGEGNISDEMVQDQIDVMNADYSSMNITYVLASLDRTGNNSWFFHPQLYEYDMKRALTSDATTYLNLYTTQPAGGVLGWCYFPWSFPEDSVMNGCVLYYQSLPGGNCVGYNLGRTATHEVGHALGLYHVFQDGCSEYNDFVEDTPAESEAHYGCPSEGVDTCESEGEDPFHNFMDYVDDDCMTEFSMGQGDRAREMTALYRPGWLDADLREALNARSADPWAFARQYQSMNSRDHSIASLSELLAEMNRDVDTEGAGPAVGSAEPDKPQHPEATASSAEAVVIEEEDDSDDDDEDDDDTWMTIGIVVAVSACVLAAGGFAYMRYRRRRTGDSSEVFPLISRQDPITRDAYYGGI